MKFKYHFLAAWCMLVSSALLAQRPKTTLNSAQGYQMQQLQKTVEKGMELIESMKAKPLVDENYLDLSIPGFPSKADIEKELQNQEREFWEDFRKEQVTKHYQNLSEIIGYPKRQSFSPPEQEEIDKKIEDLVAVFRELYQTEKELGLGGAVEVEEPTNGAYLTASQIFDLGFSPIDDPGAKGRILMAIEVFQSYKTIPGKELRPYLENLLMQRKKQLDDYRAAFSLISEAPSGVAQFQAENGLASNGFFDAPIRSLIDEKLQPIRELAAHYQQYSNKLAYTNLQIDVGDARSLQQFCNDFQAKKGLANTSSFDEKAQEELAKTVESLRKELVLLEAMITHLAYEDCIAFQVEKGLETTNTFTPKTRMALAEEAASIEAHLEATGFVRGDLGVKAEAYRQVRQVEGAAFRATLEEDHRQKKFWTPQGRLYVSEELQVEELNGEAPPQNLDAIQYLGENVLIQIDRKRLDNLDRQIKELDKQLSRKYQFDEIQFLSLVKDQTTEAFIRKNYAHNQVRFSLNKSSRVEKLKKKLSRLSGKAVFVIGHIEGGSVVSYHKGEKIFEVSLDELYAIGREQRVNLFPFGCYSAFQNAKGSGTVSSLNSLEDTKNLLEAIQTSETYREMLLKFTSGGRKIVVDASSFLDYGYSKLFYTWSATKKAAVWILAGLLVVMGGDGDDGDDEDEEGEKEQENTGQR